MDEYTISSIIERFKSLPQSTSSFGHKTTYKYGDTASSGDRYYDVIESRHNGISNAMRQRGFKEHEIQRLAPFLTVQTILEGGYRLNRPDNNFGGMLIPHTYDKMQFKSPEEFYLAYIDNLDNNWGDKDLGEGKGWRNAKTLKEYADTINRESLGLKTQEQYDRYKASHPRTFIYTPDWENRNTSLYSKFAGIEGWVNAYLDLINTRNNLMKGYLRARGIDTRKYNWRDITD